MAVYFYFNELVEGERREQPTLLRADMVPRIGPISSNPRVGALITLSPGALFEYLSAERPPQYLPLTEGYYKPELPPGAAGPADGITLIRPANEGHDCLVYNGNGRQTPMHRQRYVGVSSSDWMHELPRRHHHLVPLSVAPQVRYNQPTVPRDSLWRALGMVMPRYY